MKIRKARWSSTWVMVSAGLALGWAAGCAPSSGGNGDTNGNSTANINDNTTANANENMAGNDNAPANDNDDESPSWQTVVEAEDAAFLAISGTSATDVYVVGADPGDGQGSMFIHYDGTAWSRISSQTTDTLWWISEAPVEGIYYLSGDNGQIVEFDPATQMVTPHVTPSDTLRVFGTWGATRDDVWAVLSDESISATGGQIWHYDGNDDQEWTVVDLSEDFPAGFPGLIKIWGRSASEIYAVGGADTGSPEGAIATAFQYDGTGWTRLDLDATSAQGRTLFSVHGNSETVGFAGGFNDGTIVEKSNPATAFSSVSTVIVFQQNGLFYRDEVAVSVGIDLSIYLREAGEWALQTDTGLDNPNLNFHGPWIDPDGGVWAVGGQLDFEPLTSGIVAYFGPESVAATAF